MQNHLALLRNDFQHFFQTFLKRPWWQVVGIVLSLVLLFTVSLAVTFLYFSYQSTVVHSTVPSPIPSPIVEEPIDNIHFNHNKPLNVLLMGYGGGNHQGGRLTDTILLASIQPAKQTIYLISIPRDLWVALPTTTDGTQQFKINAAYAIGSDDKGYKQKPAQFTGPAGGGELAKFAANQVTGLKIDKFITLDFQGFQQAIDVLGGVDLTVTRTFDDDQYPIEGKEEDTCGFSPEDVEAITATLSGNTRERAFPCRYELLHFDKGKIHVDGATALKYVRSRHSPQDGGDFNRAARQRQLLLAVKARVLALNFLPKAIPFISTLSQHLQMDIELDELRTYFEFVDQVREYQIVNLALTDQNVLMQARRGAGQDVLVPRDGDESFASIKSWLSASMSATASPSAKPLENK